MRTLFSLTVMVLLSIQSLALIVLLLCAVGLIQPQDITWDIYRARDRPRSELLGQPHDSDK